MDYTEFSDPRLVALYDALNPFSANTTFYLEAAARLGASTIIDIGCGMGLLTCELARRGGSLIGVEPGADHSISARHRFLGPGNVWRLGRRTDRRYESRADIRCGLRLANLRPRSQM
jgi:SAM-dependent methyltransferase